ncbi:class I SAM-dependent methyltransferase [Flavihumibacter sp. UBA7668]|uniref:class I SAM-dependent methyltransferase n=1 Tax=Flavihumibacter sp. UBA7668 TaxID=1946542 RepID=UPI0025C5C58E|nr:class I SAM-dependent methyltransferase [Flavihumibacter sp. UBA7668]
MVKEFWNQRYATNETVYGKEPNAFFKLFIDLHKPGTVLLPAEGEGRNALYAAKKGWTVHAFDFKTFKANQQYDLVASIYVHLPPALRKTFHQELIRSIKPGGFLLLEAFAKEQIEFDSGGPKDEALLYNAPTLCNDFKFLHLLNCEQKELRLKEGEFHSGKAAVLRLTGQKI